MTLEQNVGRGVSRVIHELQRDVMVDVTPHVVLTVNPAFWMKIYREAPAMIATEPRRLMGLKVELSDSIIIGHIAGRWERSWTENVDA